MSLSIKPYFFPLDSFQHIKETDISESQSPPSSTWENDRDAEKTEGNLDSLDILPHPASKRPYCASGVGCCIKGL